MPKKITAFACEWKCGRTVLTKRTGMVAHEYACNWNPTNKACITCSNFCRAQDEESECLSGEEIGKKLRNHCDKWRP